MYTSVHVLLNLLNEFYRFFATSVINPLLNKNNTGARLIHDTLSTSESRFLRVKLNILSYMLDVVMTLFTRLLSHIFNFDIFFFYIIKLLY